MTQFGCEYCEADMARGSWPFAHLKIAAYSASLFLALYECGECGAWYEYPEQNDRFYPRSPDEVKRLLAWIEDNP